MVNAVNSSYQPAVAYQGGQVNTPQQEPKSGKTQPKQAPAADTQHGGQRPAPAKDHKEEVHQQAPPPPPQQNTQSDNAKRGQKVNVKA